MVDFLGLVDNFFKFGEYFKIWIDFLDILIDGKYVVEFLLLNNGVMVFVWELDVIFVNGDDFKFLFFFDKRIFVIGESVYGIGMMNDMGVEIIKNRIEYGKCRFVLLEMFLILFFYINWYLEGDEWFKLDSIVFFFDKVLFFFLFFVFFM